jgi:hypothetical protein
MILGEKVRIYLPLLLQSCNSQGHVDEFVAPALLQNRNMMLSKLLDTGAPSCNSYRKAATCHMIQLQIGVSQNWKEMLLVAVVVNGL